jgi:hypothetical protein
LASRFTVAGSADELLMAFHSSAKEISTEKIKIRSERDSFFMVLQKIS